MLSADIAAAYEESKARFVTTLERDGQAVANLLGTLAALYVTGAPVRLDRVFETPVYHRVSLPLYPFRRERHWVHIESLTDGQTELSPWVRPSPTQAT